MPGTYCHVRSDTFTKVRAAYRATSELWKLVETYVGTEGRSSGVFGRLSRLSENARCGAILQNVESSVMELLNVNRLANYSVAEMRTILRASCDRVLQLGLQLVSDYNSFSRHLSAEAMTEFGAAFALACSDTTQTLPTCALPLSQKYGILIDTAERVSSKFNTKLYSELVLPVGAAAAQDELDVGADIQSAQPTDEKITLIPKATVIPKEAKHRFTMSAAAAELGANSFGLPQADEKWDSFEGMFTSLLSLHAHSVLCAASKGIDLAPVPGVGDDPLSPIKQWLRKHCRPSGSGDPAPTAVLTVTATRAVSTQKEARDFILNAARAEATVLEESMANVPANTASYKKLFHEALHAPGASRLESLLDDVAEHFSAPNAKRAALILQKAINAKNEDAERCVVVVRNAPNAPFADVLVGVVTNDKGTGARTVENLLLVQLKHMRGEHNPGDAVISPYEEHLRKHRMGCRSREAVIAFCVSNATESNNRTSDKVWRRAMAMLNRVPKCISEKGATLFQALCDDKNIDVGSFNTNVYVAADRHTFFGDASETARCAHCLLHYPREERVAAIEDLLKDSSKACKRALMSRRKREEEMFRNCGATEGPSNVKWVAEAYIVVYRNTPDDLTFHSPSADVLVITKGNKACAFYPTSWGDDGLSGTPAAVRKPRRFDVMRAPEVLSAFLRL